MQKKPTVALNEWANEFYGVTVAYVGSTCVVAYFALTVLNSFILSNINLSRDVRNQGVDFFTLRRQCVVGGLMV